jgi:hypothetical protein
MEIAFPFYDIKVGVFNPENPECVSSSPRKCLIKINNFKQNKLRCSNSFAIIGKHKL